MDVTPTCRIKDKEIVKRTHFCASEQIFECLQWIPNGVTSVSYPEPQLHVVLHSWLWSEAEPETHIDLDLTQHRKSNVQFCLVLFEQCHLVVDGRRRGDHCGAEWCHAMFQDLFGHERKSSIHVLWRLRKVHSKTSCRENKHQKLKNTQSAFKLPRCPCNQVVFIFWYNYTKCHLLFRLFLYLTVSTFRDHCDWYKHVTKIGSPSLLFFLLWYCFDRLIMPLTPSPFVQWSNEEVGVIYFSSKFILFFYKLSAFLLSFPL